MTFFAIWRLGAVPLPLHPRKAPAELAELARRARAAAAVGFPADLGPRALDGGWETPGGMGRIDDHGYLYLADRAADMIRTADGLVASLPIEGAIEVHPAVRSAIVIGLPGADGADRVHALVDAPAGVSASELARMLAERFPAVRVPDGWEPVEGPLRDNAGKASRVRLRAARLPAAV